MSHARATVLICACALVANIVAIPAPPRRSDNKDTEKMPQERTIVIRRVPNAYLYPFSLWPLPKYPITDTEKMPQERTIVIRRVPNAYLYPFSLWPLPKYPITEDRTIEYIYNGKTLKKLKQVEINKR